MTMDSKTIHKDYVSKTYEKLAETEQLKYTNLLEKARETKDLDYTLFRPGSVINECSLLGSRPYLNNFALSFDPATKPVIATMSADLFKECMRKTDTDQIEKLINWSKSMPGFQYVSKSASRKLFNLFTHVKVKRGWQMKNGDELDPKMYFILSGNFLF